MSKRNTIILGAAGRDFHNFNTFFKHNDNYNVVDHFSISGNLYKKQGAAWPVDMIVIEGKGKSSLPLPGAVPPKYLSTNEEVKGKLSEGYDTSRIRLDTGDRGRRAEDIVGRESAERERIEREFVRGVPGGEGSEPDRPAPRAGRGREDVGPGVGEQGPVGPAPAEPKKPEVRRRGLPPGEPAVPGRPRPAAPGKPAIAVHAGSWRHAARPGAIRPQHARGIGRHRLSRRGGSVTFGP